MASALEKLMRDNPMLAKGVIYQAAAEKSLYEFVKLMWSEVEPANPYVDGWHIKAICDHLQAITEGDILRLLINVPPGAAKSLLTDVFWPAWEWIRNPAERYICVSYSSGLTERDNIRFRQIITSDIYVSLWGTIFQQSKDQWNIIKVANNKTGWKMATSITGLTGERGTRVIVDDPISVEQANSQKERENCLRWWRETLPTRLTNPTTSAIVVIMQRTHQEDISGHILANEDDFTHLMIPQRFDPDRKCKTFLGWEDPRTEEGDLFWPQRMPLWTVEREEKKMGTFATAAQFQQIPIPRGGGIILEKWWKLWPRDGEAFDENGSPLKALEYPEMDFIIVSVDPAYTEKAENDYSAAVTLGLYREDGQPRIILMDAWQKRMRFHGTVPERRKGESRKDYLDRDEWGLVEMVAYTAHTMHADKVLVENKASGISLIQEIRRLYANENFTVQAINPKGDKIARAHAVSSLFENGVISAPNRWWSQICIDEVSIFPRGRHDDMCFIAGTMIATKRGSIPIQCVTTNDFVLTPDGWKKVLCSEKTGFKKIISRFGLTGTLYHTIFTIDKQYQPLYKASSLIIRNSLCGWIKITLLHMFFSMESNLQGWEENVNTISPSQKRILEEKNQKVFMLLFGNFIMERKFLKAMKLIILIPIRLIANLIILSAYRKTCIVQWLKEMVGSAMSKCSMKFDRLQQHGIGLRKEKHGIESTQKIQSEKRGKFIRRLVWYAERFMSINLWEKVSSAHTIAQLNIITDRSMGIIHQAMSYAQSVEIPIFQKHLLAQNSVDANAPINMDSKIESLVYNLKVESPSCFFANDILVHNCDALVHGIKYLRDTGWALRTNEYEDEIEPKEFRGNQGAALYDV